MKHDIYPVRAKRWTSLNPAAATLGTWSSQRSEAWHAQLKGLTSPDMYVLEFIKTIYRAVDSVDRIDNDASREPRRHATLTGGRCTSVVDSR
jgi:hypothetical protein